MGRVEHTTATVARVRELVDAGWKPAEVQRVLLREGISVHFNSIRRWTNPEFEERWRLHNRDNWRRKSIRMTGVALADLVRAPSDHLAEARIGLLADAGLGSRNIAKVMLADFGDGWDESVVRRVLDQRELARREVA